MKNIEINPNDLYTENSVEEDGDMPKSNESEDENAKNYEVQNIELDLEKDFSLDLGEEDEMENLTPIVDSKDEKNEKLLEDDMEYVSRKKAENEFKAVDITQDIPEETIKDSLINPEQVDS